MGLKNLQLISIKINSDGGLIPIARTPFLIRPTGFCGLDIILKLRNRDWNRLGIEIGEHSSFSTIAKTTI